MPDIYTLREMTKPTVRKGKFGLWNVQCIMCLHRKQYTTWKEAYYKALYHSNASPLHRQMVKLKKQLGDARET